jgi:hypothetical protein
VLSTVGTEALWGQLDTAFPFDPRALCEPVDDRRLAVMLSDAATRITPPAARPKETPRRPAANARHERPRRSHPAAAAEGMGSGAPRE